MTSCPHCGETSFYPQGPHTLGPCPLLKKEIDQRLRHAEAEHQARLARINNGVGNLCHCPSLKTPHLHDQLSGAPVRI